MTKDFLQRYASLLCHYCLDIQAGQVILIKSTFIATPLLQVLQDEISKIGAVAHFQLQFEEQHKRFLEHSKDTQFKMVADLEQNLIEKVDAILTIKAPYNLNALSQIPEQHKVDFQKSRKKIKDITYKRSSENRLKWCLCVYPNQSMAASCNLNLDEYSQFVSQACFLDKKEPQNAWKALSRYQEALIAELAQFKKFHVLGPNTDLWFSCDQRLWINSDGKRNMPSGEIFSSPVESETEGFIYFDFPSLYQGREVAGVTLTFEKGQVVKHHAKLGQAVLDAVLEVPGARCFGEVAFGTNTHIQRATKDILFDEKIGGSMHFAIGSAYPETGGINQSVIHWDMIKDMSQGQVYADGKLIYENGSFLF